MQSVSNVRKASKARDLPLYHSDVVFTQPALDYQDYHDKKHPQCPACNLHGIGQHESIISSEEGKNITDLESLLSSPSSATTNHYNMPPEFEGECCIDPIDDSIDSYVDSHDCSQMKWNQDEIASSMFFEDIDSKLEHWTKAEHGVNKIDNVVDNPAALLNPKDTRLSSTLISPTVTTISLPLRDSCLIAATSVDSKSSTSLSCTEVASKPTTSKISGNKHVMADMGIDELLYNSLMALRHEESLNQQHPSTQDGNLMTSTVTASLQEASQNLQSDESAAHELPVSSPSDFWSLSGNFGQANETPSSSAIQTNTTYPSTCQITSIGSHNHPTSTDCDPFNAPLSALNDTTSYDQNYQTDHLTNSEPYQADALSNIETYDTEELFNGQGNQTHNLINDQDYQGQLSYDDQACLKQNLSGNQSDQRPESTNNQYIQTHDLSDTLLYQTDDEFINRSYQMQYSSDNQDYQAQNAYSTQGYPMHNLSDNQNYQTQNAYNTQGYQTHNMSENQNYQTQNAYNNQGYQMHNLLGSQNYQTQSIYNNQGYQTHGLSNNQDNHTQNIPNNQAWQTPNLSTNPNYQTPDELNNHPNPTPVLSGFESYRLQYLAPQRNTQTQDLNINQNYQGFGLFRDPAFQRQRSINNQSFQTVGLPDNQNSGIPAQSTLPGANANTINNYIPQTTAGPGVTAGATGHTARTSGRGVARDATQDQLLLNLKGQGLSYKEVKARGGFQEAESTLRGRYRTLTKDKDQRVRKPEWSDRDVAVLKNLVARCLGGSGGVSLQALGRVPWKKVAEAMERRGCYRYGNATVKKKYVEVMGISQGV